MLWAGGLAASIAYQWSQDIPRSLKVIHSRVYAQVCLALRRQLCMHADLHVVHSTIGAAGCAGFDSGCAGVRGGCRALRSQVHDLGGIPFFVAIGELT